MLSAQYDSSSIIHNAVSQVYYTLALQKLRKLFRTNPSAKQNTAVLTVMVPQE